MKEDTIVIITGLIVLTIIQLYALSKGINGALMSGIIGIIGSGIGYKVKSMKSEV